MTKTEITNALNNLSGWTWKTLKGISEVSIAKNVRRKSLEESKPFFNNGELIRLDKKMRRK